LILILRKQWPINFVRHNGCVQKYSQQVHLGKNVEASMTVLEFCIQ
jgi:hypothetical protein